MQWIRNRRRRKIARQPFPKLWDDIMRRNVAHVRFLSEEQSARLRFFIQVFVAEKYWEGCDGQLINDEVKVTIAAQVGLLSLGRYPIWFDHVLSILVYPEEQVRQEVVDHGGVMTEVSQMQLGEAVWQGPVILSWVDVLTGGRRSGAENLVVHEFVHQLDMANGRLIDGIPPLRTQQEIDNWVSVMKDSHERLQRLCQHGAPSAIDCYGVQNAAEFFASAAEAFFENATAMKNEDPRLYDLFAGYFELDPSSWDG